MPSLLEQVRVVLYEPQKAVNIAGTVRAMANMGVSRLRLVRPTPYDENLIEVVAHKTRDIVAAIEHFDTLDAAIGDCVRVVGFTGRPRAAKWPRMTPREAAEHLLGYAADGPVAVMFGREDDGLPGEAMDRAHAEVTIPTTERASLNVAQAVLVGLYELHLASGDATRALPRNRNHAPPPEAKELENLFGDAERALEALDFFKTRNPDHVMRSVRSLVFRARPDARETGMLRSMCFEVLRTIERIQRRVGEG
ncbi:RNA methyltransferase [Roseisolibacter sp. H3M3-2]|uniref:RNA methyltransferase n=1 Tax=Roseisolibacter sp. H3M3-2 TaxID=3031323 RepID=UPI0023DA62C9|nr:RNA methyltransferase [Roseisolibacter sp. H3M3-2]MDF1503491.1 RNA methyltransferase [Roseisolibacter sp. H3M3-2]